MRLETRELHFLLAVAENRGFARAAEQLAISQSAVSQTISGLEKKLEQRLIERSPFALTDAGERLLIFAQSQGHEEALVLRDLDDIRRGEQAKLSLAVNGTINRYHAPLLVHDYCKANPFARLHIEELPSRKVLQAVVSGAVELGMGPFQSHMPALEVIPLYEELRTLVVARKHPLMDQLRSNALETLGSIPLIVSYLDEPEQRPGIQRIRNRFSRVWEVSSTSLRLRLLVEAHGVGYVGDQVLAQESICDDLTEVKSLEFSRIKRQVGLVYRKHSSLTPGARRFVKLCRERWPE